MSKLRWVGGFPVITPDKNDKPEQMNPWALALVLIVIVCVLVFGVYIIMLAPHK